MTRVIGHYELRDTLKRGGMATVYLAYDTKLQREVALKALPTYFAHDPEFSERFAREVQTISTLEHNAIVPVYDYGELNMIPFLVMRYMHGGNLGERLQTGPLSLEQTASILNRVAAALDKAHQQGILHRDVKPDNILFDAEGSAYLADFGIVKLAEGSTMFTRTGNILGTPAYMSPEQAEGQLELDPRTDIYSLGVVFYEMLTGAIPYQANTPLSQALMHVREPVPRIREANPELPAEVQVIVERAMAKARAARYPTAGTLAEAVQELVKALAAPIPPSSPDLGQIKKPTQAEATPEPEADITAKRVSPISPPADLVKESVESPAESEAAAGAPTPAVRPDIAPALPLEVPAAEDYKAVPLKTTMAEREIRTAPADHRTTSLRNRIMAVPAWLKVTGALITLISVCLICSISISPFSSIFQELLEIGANLVSPGVVTEAVVEPVTEVVVSEGDIDPVTEIVVTEEVAGPVTEVVVPAETEAPITEEPIVVEVAPDEGIEETVTLHYNWGLEPESLDPATAWEITSSGIIGSIFMGLTDMDDETTETIPALAASWEVSEDSTVWTFHLREDIPWVQYSPLTGEITQEVDKDGNPRFVNALDVVYGVRRAIDPNAGSYYAHVLNIIKNAQAVNADSENFTLDDIGVAALDNSTVQFTLENPAAYFPAITSLWITYPVPHWFTEEASIGDRWTEVGEMVTNGPYVVTEWLDGTRLVLERNPFWPLWGQSYGSGNIKRIEGVFTEDSSVGLTMYESSEIDTAQVASDQFSHVTSDSTLSREYVSVPINCTYLYYFITQKPPLNDVRVRRALAMAIDRMTLAETVTPGGTISANTLIPSSNFGHHAEDPDLAPWALTVAKGGTGYARAVEMGQELLAEAGFPNGQGLEIRLIHNALETHARIAYAIKVMWQNAFPQMNIRTEGQEMRDLLGSISPTNALEDSPHAFGAAWCGDYYHAHSWLYDSFHPAVSMNWSRMTADDPQIGNSVLEFINVVETAQITSPEDSTALYKSAEQLLLDQIAAIAPIYYLTNIHVTKPWLSRSYHPFNLHIFQWELDWDAKVAATQ